MPSHYAQLMTALACLLDAIDQGPQDGNGAGKPDIAAAIARVDRLREALGPELPGQLRHFLDRRSYQKAIEFLHEHGDDRRVQP